MAFLAASWSMGACGTTIGDLDGPYYDVEVTCDNFCNIMLRHCRGKWQMYPSLAACLDTCAGWPDDSNASYTDGNTLQCRFAYATLAARKQNRTRFCVNGGPSGGQMCQD